jgi:hypothetical protein
MLEFEANDDHARLPGGAEGEAQQAGPSRPPIVRRARDLGGPGGADADDRGQPRRPPAQLARLRARARGGCVRAARPARLALARTRRLRRLGCHRRPGGIQS